MWDDVAPKSSNDLLDALSSMASGAETTSRRAVEHVDADGNVSTSKVAEQRTSSPNLEALKSLLETRIGGPQDWC